MRNGGINIPAPTPETGHFFVRSRSQKPARFPAEQKERSFVETLLFPVSRGRRYNTLYFALPAIKRLRRLMASLGDCRQSLSLVRRCRTSCKAVCQGDAVPVGSSATKPPVSLDSSGQRERRPLWIPRPKEGRHPPLESSQKKQNRMCLLISTFRSAFTEKRKRNRPVLCFF